MAIPIDAPIAVSGVKAPANAYVLTGKEWKRERKRRNRPPKTREELEHRLAVHERFMAESTAIRERHGLPPLKENSITTMHRAALAALDAKEPKKAPLTVLERAAQVKKAEDKMERERQRIEREKREVAAEARESREVGKVAQVLGVTRQRVYQLAPA
jgi:hypothetical protein